MKQNCMSVKLLAVALLMATTVAVSACGGEKTPDAESATDTEASTPSVTVEETETEALTEVNVSIKVQDQKGNPIPNATLIISAEVVESDSSDVTDPITLTTAADGTVSSTLTVGEYSVTFENLPEYHLSGMVGITVAEDGEPILIEVTNNTPDGSETHPFFISENQKTVAFAADTVYHFTMFAGDRRSLVIRNPDVEVTLAGVVYRPDETGTVTVPLTVDNMQNHIPFSVKSMKAQDVILTIVSEPGSTDNPIPATAGTDMIVQIPKDTVMYYTFTAEFYGSLTLTTADTINNISMTNKNTSETTNFSNGSTEPMEIGINKGDVVIIAVSTVGGDSALEFQTVTFKLMQEIQ